jgi:hypothetical protein
LQLRGHERAGTLKVQTGETIAFAIVATILLLIGWSRFFDPFVGDQALFLIGAEKLQAGGVLYRDFWDIKQPGVFTFFLLGGRMFGFSQVGEHVADLVWQIAFAFALVLGLRASFAPMRLVAAFAPIAVIGSYYAGSSCWHLLQVEELAGLPLFCSAWLMMEALRRSSKRLALVAGIVGGVALSLKLIFLIVLVGILAAVLLTVRAASRETQRLMLLQFVLGVSVPIACIAGYSVLHATEATTFRTTFVISIEILYTPAMHAPAARLADSAMRFLLYFRGIILLGIIGLFTVDRTSAPAKAWRAICVTWVACDLVVIAIQISSWWQYHFLLLIPPVGILATFGLGFLIRNGMRSYPAAFASLAIGGIVSYVAVPLPQGAIGTILRVAAERPFESERALERYRLATNSEYADAFADSSHLRNRAPGTTVYVFGDPLIYVDSNTAQAIAMNSWAIQLFTPALWKQTVAELSRTKPDFVFVFDRFADHLRTNDGGAAMNLLSRDYAPTQHTRDGEWFVRRVNEAGGMLDVAR